MTWNLNEPFTSKQGEWQDFAPTDGTEAFDSFETFLFEAQHVDLRNFRSITSLVPVPQTDLDALAQTVLDGEAQTAMEEKIGNTVVNEAWVLSTHTGTHNNLTVGKQAAHGGWSGATFTTDGTALTVNLDSIIATEIDVTEIGGASLRLTFPDYDCLNFDQASSYVMLTSGSDFTSSGISDQILFSAGGSNSKYLLFNVEDFTNAGFDPTKVTGIRIHLVKAAGVTNNTVVTIMGCRIENSATWDGGSYIDFDTILQAACVPVSFDGSYPPPTTTNLYFEFVRGDESADDPIPQDVAMNMYFSPGGGTSPNDATGSDYNKLGFIMREIKDEGGGTGSHIEATISFNDTATNFEAKRVDTTGGSPGTPSTFADYTFPTITGVLDPAKYYLFHVELIGTSIDAKLYETDYDLTVGALVWQLETTLTDVDFLVRSGRVGYFAGFLSRDGYVKDISVSPQGYATLETEVFVSRSPVDGAQLQAIFSTDINLWDAYTGPDFLIDQTKTLSGTGSYRTTFGITTNTFVVDDWTEMYFDFQIWVPSGVTKANQPIVLLNTPEGTEQVIIPTLQPAQWNFVHCDMTIFQNLINGVGYSFSILAAPSPDKPLGNFWVDETAIGRRRVRWAIRAQANGTYREFKDMINNPRGAVHFLVEERGINLQVKAVALTQDAWISSFKLFPHYAPLGNFVFDKVWDTNPGRFDD